jgi:poly(A) polymerase
MTAPAEQLATSIVQRLQAAGHVAYFAGGCVRDRLLGSHPKDFDVATSARPEQVLRLFPRSQQVGAAFGVILVRERKNREDVGPPPQVEVATFRSDGSYSDGRHPDSVRFTTAEEDAQRRDFTCNGIFLDPLADEGAGRIHDFVGGQKDIEQRILRAIGDPAARFAEDHLRMLRAVRFAARLSFAIDPATRGAICRLAGNIKSISRERIGDEFGRILEHPTRGAAVRLLEELGLLLQIWPAGAAPAAMATQAGADRWARVDHLPERCPRTLAMAAVYRDLVEASGRPPGLADAEEASGVAEQLQRAFALSNDERDDIGWLLDKLRFLAGREHWRRSIHKKLLADRRWLLLRAFYLAERRGALDAELDGWAEGLRGEPGGVAPAPFITGSTLIQLGAVPGPGFKPVLDALYERQLENEFPTAAEAVAAARALVGR